VSVRRHGTGVTGLLIILIYVAPATVACASVGIVGVTPHTLRHTFGSVAGDLGFSELTIRALLGHAAQSVTQGYVHIDEALKLAVTRTCEKIATLLDEEDQGEAARQDESLAA
jgi:integrase